MSSSPWTGHVHLPEGMARTNGTGQCDTDQGACVSVGVAEQIGQEIGEGTHRQ